MIKDYVVRPYQSGDEEEIVPLLELVFDGWPPLDIVGSPIDYWRWKFKSNPLNLTLPMLALSNDRIIGCEHLIPLRIKIGKKIVPSVTDVDVAVHPDFRGRGISKNIGAINDERKRKAEIIFGYAITGNPLLIKSLPKRYPRFPHIIVNLVKINDIDKQFQVMPVKNTLLTKLGFHAIKLLNKLRYVFKFSRSQKQNVNISDVSNFDDRINGFWEAASHEYDFIVERRRDFLNWRYCDPRVGNFVVKQAEENGIIVGYSVLRINHYQPDYPIGYIVDLLTLPDRSDVVDVLVDEALHYFEENNINIINYQVVKGHPYERVLKRHGFLDSRIKIHLFYNLYEKEDSVINFKKSPASKIFISWGDHDILPVKMPDYR